MRYPQVLTEEETLLKFSYRHGCAPPSYRGLCRFGDGDFNVMRGRPDRFQKHESSLANALGECLAGGSNKVLNCLIPPPRVEAPNPMKHRWESYLEANAAFLPFLEQELYGSSNVSRMDSAPQLHTIQWWRTCADLWRDQNITLVRGSLRSLTYDKLMHAPGKPKHVTEVITKPKDSWTYFDEIFDDIVRAENETVILCTGLVARPLVHRLVEAGHRAFDLGHLGIWFDDRGSPIPLVDCPR